MVGPLVGLYELRHADAHLPSSDLDGAFALAGVDRSSPWVFQGLQLLDACVSSLDEISRIYGAVRSKIGDQRESDGTCEYRFW